MISPLTRRRFLSLFATGGLAMGLGGFSFLDRALASGPADQALASLLPAGQIAPLPPSGTVLIVNDFHAKLSDWRLFLQKTRVFERMAAGEDLYLVINGDVVDQKTRTSEAPGDDVILFELAHEKEKLARAGQGNRLVLLLGNHEFQCMALYDALNRKKDLAMLGEAYPYYVKHQDMMRRLEYEKRPSTPDKEKTLLGFASQFNFIYRMKPRHREILKTFQTCALAANGLFICHAGYPRAGHPNPLWGALWERGGDGKNFCAQTSARLIVNGHTFPDYFGTKLPGSYDAARRLGIASPDRVVIAPSFGASLGGGGSYLTLDLARTYETQKDLVLDRDVAFLH